MGQTRNLWKRVCMGGCVVASLCGCAGPDFRAAANRLREQNVAQERQIADLTERLTNREATIRTLRREIDGSVPRVATLADERLAQLFTVSRLEIRSETDSWDFGDGKGISGFRVFLRPLTDDGTIIPATGTLTVEAFELPAAPQEPRRIGSWTFTPQDMKKSWYGGLGLNHFAMSCPWSEPPKQRDLTFKVRLVDALTGATLETQLNKKVELPSATTKP